MAAGGEGAPLVPYSEYLIFKSHDKNIILQNIGGISNLTYLPKNCSIEEVIAFDNGVGNIMIDYFTKKNILINHMMKVVTLLKVVKLSQVL